MIRFYGKDNCTCPTEKSVFYRIKEDRNVKYKINFRVQKKEGNMLAQGKLLRNVLIMNMDSQLENISEAKYGKNIAQLTAEQIYIVVICMVKGLVETFIRTTGEKKFYYISTAFEKGSFLENNLLNLGIYDILEGVLVSKGQEMATLKKVEEEYIGAANSFEQTSKNFFIQSKKNGLPAEAMGIRYIKEYEDREKQIDNYHTEKSWLEKQEMNYRAAFNGINARIFFYTMDVVGKDKEIYKFHLQDLEIEDEIEEQEKQIYYDYFLVNSCVKKILLEMRNNQYDLRKMNQYASIGIEGKYVAFVIPELIRIMVDEKAIPVEEAIEVVRKTCGYSDLSMMTEAVKQCPLEYVEKLVPHLIEKIEVTMQNRAKIENTESKKVEVTS